MQQCSQYQGVWAWQHNRVQRQYLEHVSVLESTPTSGLHPHVGLCPLPTAGAVVEILRLDELQTLLDLGSLKLDKVQVAYSNHPQLSGTRRNAHWSFSASCQLHLMG